MSAQKDLVETYVEGFRRQELIHRVESYVVPLAQNPLNP